MNKPPQVTFDKNVYEFVVDPDKQAKISDQEKADYREIHELILQKKITPFITEFILTYEVLPKTDRQKILSNSKPLLFAWKGTKMTISSNPQIHPGNHPKDDLYLAKAISLGFRILPGKRFGKLVNPAIKNEWYHFQDEDYLDTTQRFADIVGVIQNMGAGYRYYQEATGMLTNLHLNTLDNLKRYSGSQKKLSSAISEWSDGDSVALHILYGLDYFCTNDKAKRAGEKSVFSPANYSKLNQRFGFKKVTPFELLNAITK